MKVGMCAKGFPGAAAGDPIQTMELARQHGLDGFFFSHILRLSEKLDAGEMHAVKSCADDLGLYLELGLGRVNPYAFTANPEISALGDGDYRAGMERLIRAARRIDCTELCVFAGGDRFNRDMPWLEQLGAVHGFLASLAPLLRDLGCRLNLETHEEITTFEIVRLIEALGPDILGITLDTPNLLVRTEDPVAAARRAAPYAHQTHIEDCIIYFVSDGLERKLRPCGRGIIDWQAVISILGSYAPDLNLSIEIHQGQFGMHIYSREWFESHPDLTAAELAEVVRLAKVCDDRIVRGDIPGPAACSVVPSDQEKLARLHANVEHLRKLIEVRERPTAVVSGTE